MDSGGETRRDRRKDSFHIGDISEIRICELLKSFDSVASARRDRFGSKFDIFYELKGEGFTRGLQVKTICRCRNSDIYQMCSINKYNVGMLLIGIRYPDFGIIHLINEFDKDYTSVYLSPVEGGNPEYNKEILKWPEFIIELEKSLKNSIIITPEVFRNSVSRFQYLEYENIERFKVFCLKHSLEIELVYNVSSPTDLIVNGFNVQMKYSTKRQIGRRNSGKRADRGYMIKSCRWNKNYEEGQNDFYVIEIEHYHGEYLWIPEYLFLKKAAKAILIYPYDYVEQERPNYPERYQSRVKGNWTSNKRYWISTEKGCLGSTNDVAIHIENLLIEEWIDSH